MAKPHLHLFLNFLQRNRIHTYAHKKLIKATVEDIDGFDTNFTKIVTRASWLPALQLLFD
jgi:hypothetical protein